MVKFRAQPGINGVALLALDGKIRGNVIGGGSLLVGVLVTGVALDRKSLELSNRPALMAIGAIEPGMPSDQGEAIIVFPDSLQNDVPAFYGVTLLAVSPHLAAMNIGVTVSAIGTGVGEDGLGMTLGAGHAFVQTAQRVPGFVVIELGDGADGLPTRGGMAVLTSNIQVAMRTAGDRISGLTVERTGRAARKQTHGSPTKDRRRQ